jgi:hypothetical protein
VRVLPDDRLGLEKKYNIYTPVKMDGFLDVKEE